jgi:ribonucleoside-diphosphate reductase alpha subunit
MEHESSSITEKTCFPDNVEMNVTKRNGNIETVSFDKILNRIKTIGQEVGIHLNYTNLAIKVIHQLYDNILTTKIDELSAEQCASMASIHPDYNVIAGRIIVSNHHKNTVEKFSEVVDMLYFHDDKHGNHYPLVSKELYNTVLTHKDVIDSICDYSRDYLIDYFGFKTLERAYLIRKNKKIIERPQHMWLRVSIGIHGDDLERIKETYDLMSKKYFTHATPTLFNAGTQCPQLSSCYLLAVESDSVEGIYNTLKDCALISKYSGGIGLHIHNIRATDSHIRGTNGSSSGIVPMLRVFNNTARYIDQCVVPETIIYTTDGPKEIQHCVSGETCSMNLYGETEVIQDVLEHNYSGELLEISTRHSIFPLQVTPEHPIYVLRNQELGTIKTTTFFDRKEIEFEWVDAKELEEGDMIVYSIPKYEKDVASISKDDCYVYGIFLSDNYSNNRTENIGQLVFHTENKKDVIQFVTSYLNRNLVSYQTNVYKDSTTIEWKYGLQLPFRYSDLYNSSNLKQMNNRWLQLPIEKSKYILKGLLETHGCFSTQTIHFDNESLHLIESIRYLCLKLGVLTSGSVKEYKGIDDTTISYSLSIPMTETVCELFSITDKGPVYDAFFRYGDFIATPVEKIRKQSYTGILYDLQLEKEHNYMIHNGLVHNGGGKRNGSFAIYLEPWHADIEVFLQMRKNHGDEELKARDLFYALWIPDLFMERVKTGGTWTIMCPDECPGLSDVCGDEFKKLYESYETAGKGRKTMKARDLWFQILDAQMETGTPYIVYKDAANRKSNQQNVGTIKSSNLCSEIIEYSDDKESAVCNLASIALPSFITSESGTPVFDYEKLHKITSIITYNLNKIIDVNFYPTDKTERSNKRHRPIGIGVQGLADVFMTMGFSFTSQEAKKMNRDIFETIYHSAMEESCNIAMRDGPYETFAGSPASKGIFQFDMWNVDPGTERYDWGELKTRVQKHGIRNSLLLAPMPTASTSQILGFNECIEPITSNIYSRRTIAGEFIIANKYLMNDLIRLNLWNEKIKNNIIANNGSIQQMDIIPQEIRDKYKTVWELPMRSLIDMAADRGAFICQSQSLNLWMEDPNYNSLTSMHFYGWSKGLKTGIYYLRRRGRHQAQQFTIEPEKKQEKQEEEHEICEMCSA